MIFDRFYTPADDELIYHYCSAMAFIEIIKSRTVWSSAYYVLNDSTEREWGYSIFGRAVDRLRGELGQTFIDSVGAMIHRAYSSSIVMISSFSLDPDVLSQWRAYADGGRGFAVGFSPKLMKMPAKKLRVLYDEESQFEELVGNLRHTFEYEKSIGFRYDKEFQRHWQNVGFDLCAYKNPAFREEKEIRFAHMSGLVPEGKSWKIVSAGAQDRDEKMLSSPLEVRFRTSDGILVPYVALDYSNRGKMSPIKEVILGSRNENAESSIEIVLNTLGVDGVSVRRSRVPYR
jgi:Protein of unknown function (DUF2971)